MKTNRTFYLYFSTLFLLFCSVSGWALDNDAPPPDVSIQVDTAVQLKGVGDDSSKAEEYGEVPEGFLINHVRIQLNLKDDRYLDVFADRARLNNAHYGMEYGVQGKYRLNVDYLKIPHLFSRTGETIWTETAPGVWELPDSVQSAIQNLNNVDPTDPTYGAGLAAQKAFVSSLLANAQPVSLGLQRNRSNVSFEGTPSRNWKYDLGYFQENRDGTRPFGTTFGFSWTTELPETIDYRTQNVHAGVEYRNNGKLLAASYDLSLFNNAIDALRWDNPLRFTDRTYDSAYVAGDGTSLGQMQLPADNTANTLGFQAAYDFGRSRVSGTVNYSIFTDQVQLLPFTVNSAIPALPLPSPTFNGNIRNLNIYLNYTSRFGSKGTINAFYRLYDQSNHNDDLFFTNYVRVDQVLEPLGEANPLFGYKYNTLNFDVGYNLAQDIVWHGAYQFEGRNYDEREINKNSTNSFKTSVDWLASENTTVRVSYQYARRKLDQFANSNPTYDVIPLRRFDISDVNRNLLRADAEFSIGEKSSVGFNASLTKNDYQDVAFGLQKSNEFNFGADYSYSLTDSSSLNVWYEYQSLTSDQNGRQSGATPSTDPAADWSANLDDKYNTAGLGYTTNFHQKKMTWDTYVTYARANGAANLVSPPGGVPDVAKSLVNMDDTDLVTFKSSVSWRCGDHTRIGFGYWLENYGIDDFAEDTIRTDLTQFGSILLNARQPGYFYNTGWISLLLNW